MSNRVREFSTDDRVVIKNLNTLLNEGTGTVVGWDRDFPEWSSYIVLLDIPVSDIDGFVHKAVSLPHFSLEKV